MTPIDSSPPLAAVLRPGHNCWRIAPARRVAFLIDGQAYFGAVRAALARARRSIYILGWDIDSRMTLVPEPDDGLPGPLGEFLDAVVARGHGVQARVLSWDFAMLFALEREWLTTYKLDWLTHRHLRFRLDDRHPFGASHHQKVVVVDDAVAFVSGFDLTRCRWDTPAHAPDEPHRVDPDGRPYAPFHDVGAIVEGDVARALGDLARERWSRATGTHPKPPAEAHDNAETPWPPGLPADLEDVQVAIARTAPRFDGYEAIEEIRRLHADAIASARRWLYLENQYFSSAAVGDALQRRLAEPDGPEVVLVTPQRESGWLEETTMGVLRSRLHRRLSAVDRHGRYRAYCPLLPELGEQCLNVHSKVMTVDDELLTLGSANLSNRSMGLDTECNLVIEAAAQGDAASAQRVRAAVAGLRNRLLAEHLAVPPDRVAAALRQHGSLVATVEALRGSGRTLAPSRPEVAPELDALVPDSALIDPEAPLEPERFVAEFVPPETSPRVSRRVLLIALIVAALGTLAVVWRLTPLHELLDLATLVSLAERLRDEPLAPLLTLLAYVVGALLVMPVTALIAATGIVFGPALGFVYAVSGSLLGAAVTYGIGRLVGREAVRRFAGRRINRLSRLLARRGVVAMTVLRLLPVAPFTVVNVVAGASQISLRDYLLGTFFGMAPGICATVLFADGVADALRSPDLGNLSFLAVVVAVVVAASLLVRRQFAARHAVR